MPAVLWSIFIFFTCSLPAREIPGTFIINIPHPDKVVHFFLYFLLVIFVMISVVKRKGNNVLPFLYFFFAFLAATLYGILIEILQNYMFNSRNADLYDIIANCAGSFTGLLSFRYYYILRKKYRKINN